MVVTWWIVLGFFALCVADCVKNADHLSLLCVTKTFCLQNLIFCVQFGAGYMNTGYD